MNTKKAALFLRVLSASGNPTGSAKAVGLEFEEVAYWRKTNEKFATKWNESIERVADAAEAEAWRRGITGVAKMKYHKGQPVHTEMEYSDALLIMLLKAYRPEKFRERIDTGGIGNAAKIYILPPRPENPRKFIEAVSKSPEELTGGCES